MEKWMELLVSWLPFAVLIGLWFWFARSNGMQARASSGATLIELYAQQVQENRQMNVNLEQIAASRSARFGMANGQTSFADWISKLRLTCCWR